MSVLELIGLLLFGFAFGFFVIGELFFGWFCRMGTVLIRPGSRRASSRKRGAA